MDWRHPWVQNPGPDLKVQTRSLSDCIQAHLSRMRPDGSFDWCWTDRNKESKATLAASWCDTSSEGLKGRKHMTESTCDHSSDLLKCFTYWCTPETCSITTGLSQTQVPGHVSVTRWTCEGLCRGFTFMPSCVPWSILPLWLPPHTSTLHLPMLLWSNSI